MTRRELLTLVGCLASGRVLAAAKPPKLRVYVTLPERDGFIDAAPGLADSARDLRDEIEHAGFQLVDRGADADIRITVLGRGVGSQALGELLTIMPLAQGAIATSTPTFQNDYWVSVVLEVQTYRRVFTGHASNTTRFSMGAWGSCAMMIAKDVKAWAKVNADRLRK